MKRFISLALALIIVAAMIPAALLTASAIDGNTYTTVVTAENIVLDGLLDEPYKSSRKVVSSYWGTGRSSQLEFVAYPVVTNEGLYVLAEIKDNSLVKDASHPAGEGDKFQLYVRMNDGMTNVWGWYDVDYNNKLSKTVIYCIEACLLRENKCFFGSDLCFNCAKRE